ncbi:MAG TPA: RHS repeat-associated core domain-containing protein, partial [Candidatus Dormibacteraeota bacterium]|nr:RHS repeat-associated core domain-containing protein [Candidatus Dormibacteraeota bacterium]
VVAAATTTITGLVNGATYTFQVYAINSAGNGPAVTSSPVGLGAILMPQSSIVEQLVLDSWGRVARVIENSIPGGPTDSQTNVATGFVYDLNGNTTDKYTQAQGSGTVREHHFFDANNNEVAHVLNCVTVTNPCDGAPGAAQNVVTATAYDALNRVTDTYSSLPPCAGATGACVPLPTCVAGPSMCAPAGTSCPQSTCVDDHKVYDLSGHLMQEIANYGGGQQDPSQTNLATQYAYDADGKVTDILVPITGYDASGKLQSGLIGEHKQYDFLGRPTADIKAFSVPSWMATQSAETDYTLDIGGRPILVTGPGTGALTPSPNNRIVTANNYDDLGRPLYAVEDWGTGSANMNVASRFVYDPRGADHSWSPPTQRLPSGLETTTNYDLAGHTVSVIHDDDPSGLRLATTTVFDGLGRPSDSIDPRGIDTNTSYDALDRPVALTANYCPGGSPSQNCAPGGPSSDQSVNTRTIYDLTGNAVQRVNAKSVVDYTLYDPLGRPVAVTQNCQSAPNPPTTTSCGPQVGDQNVVKKASFDQIGNVLTTTDALQRVDVFTYDALGRKTSQTTNCVNNTGQCDAGLGTSSDQNLVTKWQLDAQGDIIQQLSPRQWTDGPLTSAYFYDALLRLVSVTEDQGSSATGHLNLPTSYSYDPSGNRLSQIDGNGFQTTYTVDRLGHVTQMTDAGSGSPSTPNTVVTYYDPAGNVTGTFDARKQQNPNTVACTAQQPETVCYTLDRVGRRVGVSYLKADTTQPPISQTFGFDADGNQVTLSDTDVATSTAVYDHLNRVSSVSSPLVGTSSYLVTTYGYDLDGGIATISDPTGSSIFIGDHLDRPATMVDALTNATTSYRYDAAGRLTSRTEANGIVSTPTYSGVDQLVSVTHVAGSTALATWTNISYDAAQNRIAEKLTYYLANPYTDPQSGASSYQYDGVDQLTQASIPPNTSTPLNFIYDKAHDLTFNAGTPQTYFNNEALNLFNGAGVGSDADGNETADTAGHALAWNSLSQLEKFSTTESYTYDALGRLTTVTGGGSTTQLVYRGITDQLIEELDVSGTAVRSYAWDGTGRQLYVKSGGSVYYEITNPHGDIAALASATGLVGTAHFDPWGNVMSSSHSPTLAGFPMGFQGAEGSWTDTNNGFVYMAARWYYPKVARFLSSDPAAGTADPRTPIGRERWLYGANSPLDHTDPTGLKICEDDNVCYVPGKNPPPEPVDTTSQNTDTYVYVAPPPPVVKPKPKPASCAWYDAICKAKQAWQATTQAVSSAWNFCKGSDVCKMVTTVGVGVAVFAGCEALSLGIGSVGCAVLAGAASGAVGGALDCKSGESMGGCVAKGAAIGAVEGLAGGVAGKVVAAVGGRIASAVISRLAPRLEAAGQNGIRDLAETCAVNSFVAGTLVLMADGTEKRIEDIQPGDLVMAGDPQRGIERAEPVQYVIVGHGLKHLYDIHVDGQVIEATYNHPFWVIEKQAFVWAEDLVPGEHLLLADGRAPP